MCQGYSNTMLLQPPLFTLISLQEKQSLAHLSQLLSCCSITQMLHLCQRHRCVSAMGELSLTDEQHHLGAATSARDHIRGRGSRGDVKRAAPEHDSPSCNSPAALF